MQGLRIDFPLYLKMVHMTLMPLFSSCFEHVFRRKYYKSFLYLNHILYSKIILGRNTSGVVIE